MLSTLIKVLSGFLKMSTCLHAYIIIPYRNDDENERKEQLFKSVKATYEMLFTDEVEDHTFIVVEQVDDGKDGSKAGTFFNRGLLLNAGFIYATQHALRRRMAPRMCNFILADVDMQPSNLTDGYKTLINGFRPLGRLWVDNPYKDNPDFFGGVLGVSFDAFYESNGFPNNYYGWGGEEDYLRWRVQNAGLPVEDVSSYAEKGAKIFDLETLPRKSRKETNQLRWESKLLWKQETKDNLNGLSTCRTAYTLTQRRPPIFKNIEKGEPSVKWLVVRIQVEKAPPPPKNPFLFEKPREPILNEIFEPEKDDDDPYVRVSPLPHAEKVSSQITPTKIEEMKTLTPKSIEQKPEDQPIIEAVQPEQCRVKTKAGTQCKKKATLGFVTCGIKSHRAQEEQMRKLDSVDYHDDQKLKALSRKRRLTDSKSPRRSLRTKNKKIC